MKKLLALLIVGGLLGMTTGCPPSTTPKSTGLDHYRKTTPRRKRRRQDRKPDDKKTRRKKTGRKKPDDKKTEDKKTDARSLTAKKTRREEDPKKEDPEVILFREITRQGLAAGTPLLYHKLPQRQSRGIMWVVPQKGSPERSWGSLKPHEELGKDGYYREEVDRVAPRRCLHLRRYGWLRWRYDSRRQALHQQVSEISFASLRKQPGPVVFRTTGPVAFPAGTNHETIHVCSVADFPVNADAGMQRRQGTRHESSESEERFAARRADGKRKAVGSRQ